MTHQINLLDHGYVKFIEAWGSGLDGHIYDDFEVGIVEAARQSTQGSFRGWDTDSKLLAHLYNNKHSTPFEFAGMTIEVQAPILVFREWQRHRTQWYSEMSARYTPLPDLYYVPTLERVMLQQPGNKQSSSTGFMELNDTNALAFIGNLQQKYRENERLYQEALKCGVPKELARCIMPVGHYSRMRAGANLRNWLAFLTLRMDPAAQWEIRQFANAAGEIIAEKFPKTWSLFARAREPK